jgi:hypothetical protein
MFRLNDHIVTPCSDSMIMLWHNVQTINDGVTIWSLIVWTLCHNIIIESEHGVTIWLLIVSTLCHNIIIESEHDVTIWSLIVYSDSQWLCCDAIFRLSMNMLWHDVQTINDHIVTPCSDYRWLCCDIMFRLSMIILWHHVQTQWSYCDTQHNHW